MVLSVWSVRFPDFLLNTAMLFCYSVSPCFRNGLLILVCLHLEPSQNPGQMPTALKGFRYLLVFSLLLPIVFLEDVLCAFNTPGWAQEMVKWVSLPPSKSWLWWSTSVIPELCVGETKTGGSRSSCDNQSSWTGESQAQWKTLNQEVRGRAIKEDIWNPSYVSTRTYTCAHARIYMQAHADTTHMIIYL